MADSNNPIMVQIGQSLVTALSALTAQMAKSLASAQSTATSATTGASGAVPAQVAGYLNITLPNGTAAKVPFYNQ